MWPPRRVNFQGPLCLPCVNYYHFEGLQLFMEKGVIIFRKTLHVLVINALTLTLSLA